MFVPAAGPFQEHLEGFELKLAAAGYMPAGRSAGGRSMVFRIVGPEGSGKSTLTNMLVRRLAECTAEDDLPVVKRDARPADLDATLAEVRDLVGARSSEGCCLIFDEVTLDMESRLHELFEQLRPRMAVTMFEVIHHAQDIRRPRPSSRVYAHELKTSWLKPEHASDFLGSRIDLFRCREHAARFSGDLAMYPFDPAEIRSVVAAAEGGVETLTLRTLNRIVSQAVEAELVNRRTDEPIDELDAAGLRERLISLRDVYRDAIAEPLETLA